jgi:hypothetical protein
LFTTNRRVNYRRELTQYAANDCSAMQGIILKLEFMKKDRDRSTRQPIDNQSMNKQPINETNEPQQNCELEDISSDDEVKPTPQSLNKLSREERHRIHNRSCTIEQRQRYYRFEVIFWNITNECLCSTLIIAHFDYN